MTFRQWLVEVGMGGGGVGGGLAPPLQKPELTAMADFHGPEGSDPTDQRGSLPPVKRKRKAREKSPDQSGPFSLARRGVS